MPTPLQGRHYAGICAMDVQINSKEVAVNPDWASDLGSVGLFFPNADSFFLYGNEILLFWL